MYPRLSVQNKHGILQKKLSFPCRTICRIVSNINAGKKNWPSSIIIRYRMAGNFGGEFILADWWF